MSEGTTIATYFLLYLAWTSMAKILPSMCRDHYDFPLSKRYFVNDSPFKVKIYSVYVKQGISNYITGYFDIFRCNSLSQKILPHMLGTSKTQIAYTINNFLLTSPRYECSLSRVLRPA